MRQREKWEKGEDEWPSEDISTAKAPSDVHNDVSSVCRAAHDETKIL